MKIVGMAILFSINFIVLCLGFIVTAREKMIIQIPLYACTDLYNQPPAQSRILCVP